MPLKVLICYYFAVTFFRHPVEILLKVCFVKRSESYINHVTLTRLHTEQRLVTFWGSLNHFCDQIKNVTIKTKKVFLLNFWVESEYVITFWEE